MSFFRKLDFVKTKADHGSFVSDDKTMFITVYMDHLLRFVPNIDPCIDSVMQNLQDRFEITDLDDVIHYLKIEIDVNFGKKIMTLRK